LFITFISESGSTYGVKRSSFEPPDSRPEPGALQERADFIPALAYDVEDAIALLRPDDLYFPKIRLANMQLLINSRYLEVVAIEDVRTTLQRPHSSRTIESQEKTEGRSSPSKARMAREAVVSLILGKQPGTVYKDPSH